MTQHIKTFLLQRYEERIEMLPQENKVSKFCMDAGFIHVVEIGQYFMTKANGEQFYAMACESSQPKGWIQGNKLDAYWKSQPTACMTNTEVAIRI